MAITAPRFNPSGVHVGSMPTPMVKADTSTASALQTVGDTIASLGKSAEYVQGVRDQRAKLEAQSRLTKVRGLYLDWEAQAEADNAKNIGEMVGARSMPKLQEYKDKLSSEDLGKYTKDLAPDELEEFNRLVSRRKVTLDSTASQRALAENKRYTIEVNGTMLQRNVTIAATNLVTGDNESAAGYLQEAQTSAMVIADQRGMSNEQKNMLLADTRAAAYNEAFSIAVKESPERAVTFYEANKGQFGNHTPDVERAMSPVYDAVSIDRHAAAYAGMRDADGNLTEQGMQEAMSGKVEVPDTMKLDDQRKYKLQSRLQAMLADDIASRKQLGNQLLSNIDGLMTDVNGHSKAQAFIEQNPSYVKRMMPEDRIALTKKLLAGPTVTDIPALQNLEAKLQVANTEEEIAAIAAESGKHVISAADRQRFISATENKRANLGSKEEKITKDVKKLWEDAYERQVPEYRSVEGKKLSDDEMKAINSYRNTALLVNELLKDLERPSITDVQKAFQAATSRFKMPDGSGYVNQLPYADVPEASREEALKNIRRASRLQGAAKGIAERRAAEGLGPDPGSPSTLSMLLDNLGELSRAREEALGFAP
jgi:hypothetical protein